MGLFTKLFGTRSQRELKKIQPRVDKILALEETYKAMPEQQLRGKTAEFKQRLTQGETLWGWEATREKRPGPLGHLESRATS